MLEDLKDPQSWWMEQFTELWMFSRILEKENYDHIEYGKVTEDADKKCWWNTIIYQK